MFSKNDEVDILIEDISNEGEGIGHVNGYALFVKDTLPGDYVHAKIIKVKKSYGLHVLWTLLNLQKIEQKLSVKMLCDVVDASFSITGMTGS